MKRSLIDITDLSPAELRALMDTACDIDARPEYYAERCRGKKLATLFFEPSTRTRLSFEAAMLELGGSVLGFSEAASSSAAKGESVADTARVVSCYADIIAMRHPLEGAPLAAARAAEVPVINAGDGGHCHPTQTLADLLTVYRAKGGFDGLTVAFCGDLKYGRTVHSLIAALARCREVRLLLVSPPELSLPEDFLSAVVRPAEIPCRSASLGEALREAEVLYMTRIQRERFSPEDGYADLEEQFVLTAKKLENAKKDLCILHPLPRVTEIATDVDADPRAKYFEQVKNGKLMRMALILRLLKDAKKDLPVPPGEAGEGTLCPNPRCVSRAERGVPSLLCREETGETRCAYCGTKTERWAR